MTNYTGALFQVSDFTAAPVILPVSSRFTDKTRIGTQSATRSIAAVHNRAVIRGHDEAGNVIRTHEHAGDFKETVRIVSTFISCFAFYSHRHGE